MRMEGVSASFRLHSVKPDAEPHMFLGSFQVLLELNLPGFIADLQIEVWEYGEVRARRRPNQTVGSFLIDLLRCLLPVGSDGEVPSIRQVER